MDTASLPGVGVTMFISTIHVCCDDFGLSMLCASYAMSHVSCLPAPRGMKVCHTVSVAISILPSRHFLTPSLSGAWALLCHLRAPSPLPRNQARPSLFQQCLTLLYCLFIYSLFYNKFPISISVCEKKNVALSHSMGLGIQQAHCYTQTLN